MKRTTRIIIAALLLLATLHLDAPPPADGGIIPPHPYAVTWVGQTAHTVVPLLWSVSETQSFTIFYDATDEPIYANLNWSYCKVDAIAITISVTWCGAYRTGPVTFDAGFNLVKNAFWVIGQQSCWVRQKIWWNSAHPKGYYGPWYTYSRVSPGGC